MSNHLFLFTIGPVQSFIAQARKTQDLYAGSKLLSDLIGYGLCEVSKIKNTEIIFPNFDTTEFKQDCQDSQKIKDRSFPNRFIAKVSIEGNANEFGKSIEVKVKDYLSKEILKKYFTDNNINLPIGAIDQIEDFLQVYWVIIPFEKDKQGQEDYKSTFTKIERYLGAVKNVRTFKQLHYQKGKDKEGKEITIYGEVGRKCSLNGEYNVKYYRRSEREQKDFCTSKNDNHLLESKLFIPLNEVHIFNYRDEETNNSIVEYVLQPGEGLSAISFLKRLYDRDGKKSKDTTFESNADIALMETIQRIKSNYKGGLLLDCYLRMFKTIDPIILQDTKERLDGQLYFEENLTKDYFIKHGYTNPEKELKQFQLVKEKQKEIKDFADSEKLKLTKYYAILTFDGDNMGKWLSGEKIDISPVRQAQGGNTELFHKALCKALGDFANWATKYINGDGSDNIQKGRTVYAGGDDFLAFVNLNHLFKVMRALRVLFKRRVSNHLRKKEFHNCYTINSEKELTFSAGIAIAHYKIPLSIVLREARRMQEQAKEIDKEKDAFGITVLKHSGETPSARMKWNVGTSSVETLRATSLLMDYLLNEKISHSFIYDFHREFARLMDKDGKITELQSDDLIKVELSRLAQRKVPEERKKEIKEFIEGKLFSLYSGAPKQTENDLTNFINFLYICSFVSRHINKKNFRQDLQDEQDKDCLPIEENKFHASFPIQGAT